MSTIVNYDENKYVAALSKAVRARRSLHLYIQPNIKQALEGAAKIFPEDDPARKLLQVALNEFPCPAKIKDRQMNLAIPSLAGEAKTPATEVAPR